jgi:phosphatidylglycerophosphatase A
LKNNEQFRNLTHTVLTRVATIGFLGYSPFAPGTVGSLFALATFLLTDISPFANFILIVAGTVVGIYASTVAEKMLKEKDSKKIIIDEFIGFYVSVLYLPKTLAFTVSAFLLFRFFDIIKPLFISKLERTLSNGLGIMADDILAGIYANIVLQLCRIIFTV